jgi:Zn-dependent protease
MDFDRGMDTSVAVERLMPAVRQVMSVEKASAGDTQQGNAVRFRGRLYHDSAETYDRLAPVFEGENLTLLFRKEGDAHLILGIPGVIRPRESNPWVNVGLFLLTLLSMLMAGVLYGYQGPVDVSSGELLLNLLRSLPSGIPFAASLLGILAAHEFGHYLAARYHKSPVSLPYFLPFPGSPFGTLGAFIQLKAPPKNRRILLDIGIAGPLAGLVVAIPVLFVGLALSDIGTLPRNPMEALGQGLEGNSVLYLAAKYLVTGKLVPMPVDYGGVNPVLYWLRYFFIGLPVPYGGVDVLLHPMAWAGWAGLLVTALNLIPAGQLDGGHVVYVLFGRRAVRFVPFIIVALVILGIVWPGWYLWAALIFFLGRTYAQPLDEITPLDDRRKALAIFGLIVFLLVFTPVPLRGF